MLRRDRSCSWTLDPFLGPGDLAVVIGNDLLELGNALRVRADPLLMAVAFALEFVVAVDGVADRVLDFAERTAQIGNLAFVFGDLRGELVRLRSELDDLRFEAGDFGVEEVEPVTGQPGVERLELVE